MEHYTVKTNIISQRQIKINLNTPVDRNKIA